MRRMSSILIVEDDRAISDLIRMTMQLKGHACTSAFTGPEAAELLSAVRFDLVFMDVMLPGMDGFLLIENLHEPPPVIFVTARIEVSDRVRGLQMGAQDYVVKPFDPIELLARAENALARTQSHQQVLTMLDVEMDLERHEVRKCGALVEMTPQEYQLLALFMRNKNIALSRDTLLNAAWGYDYLGGTRTIDIHVQKLRRKLDWERAIKTIYKVGYMLEVNA
ncbi:DNA-binding response regulator [Clostridia bacterium]|nr:DNA-binding response regulator [Clostridia bacterium]